MLVQGELIGSVNYADDSNTIFGFDMSELQFLIVDDATFTRDLVKKTLRNHFPQSTIFDASSVRKAQSILRTQQIDLILSDWEMPEMTGEEFLRWVREHEEHGLIPFIMVSSRGERDYVVQAVQAGVSDYIGKPFTAEDLVQKVTKALKRAGKMPKANARAKPSMESRGVAFGSIDALGAKDVNTPAAPSQNAVADNRPQSEAEVAQVTGAKQKPRANDKPRVQTKGQAQLIFSAGQQALCIIKEISLQALQGVIKRSDIIPALFDQVVVSIVQHDGESVARLNGFVQNISALENRIDSELIKIIIRFVDDDPEKLDHLSRFIHGK